MARSRLAIDVARARAASDVERYRAAVDSGTSPSRAAFSTMGDFLEDGAGIDFDAWLDCVREVEPDFLAPRATATSGVGPKGMLPSLTGYVLESVGEDMGEVDLAKMRDVLVVLAVYAYFTGWAYTKAHNEHLLLDNGQPDADLQSTFLGTFAVLTDVASLVAVLCVAVLAYVVFVVLRRSLVGATLALGLPFVVLYMVADARGQLSAVRGLSDLRRPTAVVALVDPAAEMPDEFVRANCDQAHTLGPVPCSFQLLLLRETPDEFVFATQHVGDGGPTGVESSIFFLPRERVAYVHARRP